jgi:hypothetical protein
MSDIEERLAALRKMRQKYIEQADRERTKGNPDVARKLEKAATRTRDRILELGGEP